MTLILGWLEANGPRRFIPVATVGFIVSWGACFAGILFVQLGIRRTTGKWWLPGQREEMRQALRDDFRVRPHFGRRLLIGVVVGFVALAIPILLFCGCNH